jgi:hypothetical protein
MTFHRMSGICLLALWYVSVAAVMGCDGSGRPALGSVEGVVTLDNTPLANAIVHFKPQTGKRSVGITDQVGHYELFYIRDVKGAAVGTHTISITTSIENARKDRVPAKYNSRSELKRDVQTGKNTFNFELSSNSAKPG